MARIRVLIAAAVVGLVLTIGGAVGYANQTTGVTGAERDCNAQRTWLASTGNPIPPWEYQFCLHDPNRYPASFWQH
jgi:hypothetical protein